ncbi:glycosyltransferase family 2 protein [Dokdonia ponticola]|uniref:Glycosyltransferase family 2 protein n=1 Tax=Dokdonia ponticola TaxID=2041041 RepID=A0ABV9I1S1_9FLAO
MQELVSVIIPVFNRAHCIEETLRCVQAQTYAHWECILVDDGSTDDSMDVVSAFAKADPRIRLLRRPDSLPKGANSCRNFGFENSKGTYINWLDSDDLMSPNKLEEQLKRLSEASEQNLVSTCKWNKFVNETTGILPRDQHINRDFHHGIALLQAFDARSPFFPCHSYLVSRRIIASSGLWDVSLRINQDGEFFTRVLIHAEKVVHPKEGMVYYRVPQKGSVSQLDSKEKAEAAIQSWESISAHLEKITPNVTYAYIENAKDYLYTKIQDPSIVKSHTSFFATQLKKSQQGVNLLRKMKRKLQQLFSVN